MNMKKVPNILCGIRICLIPFILLFLLDNAISALLPGYARILISGILYAIAMLTDLFDGRIARKYDAITDFGKFIDPIADKMLVLSILLAFVDLQIISSIPVLIILAREFLVTGLRLGAMSKGKVVAANIWGKAKTVTQAILIGVAFVALLIVGIIYPEGAIAEVNQFLQILIGVLSWIAAAVTAVSGITYYTECKEYIK